MNNAPEQIVALGDDFVRLWHEFSIFPTREEVSEKIRIYKPRTLANLDCQGLGPDGRLTIGGKVCYPRDQLVIWVAGRVKKAAA